MSKKSDYFSDIILNDPEYYNICKKIVIGEQENTNTESLEKLANKRLDYLDERCEEMYGRIN